MLENIVSGIFAIVVIVLIFLFFVWLFFWSGDTAMPVSGCVTEKIQAANGYNKPIHVLELRVSGGQMYITTSTRVYFAAVVGSCYDFDGPRKGTSYNSIKEKARE